MAKSKAYSFNKEDGKKLLKSVGIAAVGAIATVLLEIIPGIDFGPYTAAVVAVNSVICNAVLKYVQGPK